MTETLELKPDLDAALARLRGQVRPDDECEAHDAERRIERVADLRAQAEFPGRAWSFVRSRPATAGPWVEKAKKMGGLMTRPGGCLAAIVGPQGTGKTCLAVEALCAVTSLLRSARFTDVAGLVAELRDAHVRGELKATLNSWEYPAALVLDQWDKGGTSDWETRYLFRLLDRRYNDGRWTLLVANTPPLPPLFEPLPHGDPVRAEWMAGAFGEVVGASLLGRINETGGLVIADWPSFRK